MNDDFGMLVDFLRGELDQLSAARVRSRLEHDSGYFDQFQQLKRTYAILRSLPTVRPAAGVAYANDDFAAAVRREFEARDWMSLLPWINGREEFLRGLRAEFAVREMLGSIPQLLPSRSFVAALQANFHTRARLSSLPMIKPRPAWVRALRQRLVAHSTMERLPELQVREGFKRRLQVALFEASRETELVPVKTALPEVLPRDPFRRRLFKRILFSSRRRVRDDPVRANLGEYQFGRELGRGWRQSNRSMIFTMSVHALVIVLTLFIFAKPGPITGESVIQLGQGEFATRPELPGERSGSFPQADDLGPAGDIGGERWLPVGMPEDDSLDGERPLTVPEFDDRVEEPSRPPSSTMAMDFDGQRSAAGVPSILRLRKSPRASKAGYLGREDLFDVLDKSLKYLQMYQKQEGYWAVVDVVNEPRDPDVRESQRIELTAAALLAYLGDGHSSAHSELGYHNIVGRGIGWLIDRQRESGQIGPPELENVLIHAMATLVLAEEFGLTRAPHLREPLRKACRWLCDVRANGSDGFPYKVGFPASMTTSVWAYMALVTARNVRVPPVDVPKKRIEDFLDWYGDYWKYSTRITDQAQILAKSDLLPTAAAGALNLFAIEAGDDFEQSRSAFVERISRELPDLRAGRERDNADTRYLFFGSIMMALHYQLGGERSSRWNDELARTLIDNQREDGSFKPVDDYGSLYGNVFSTALAALSIENAYRVNLLTQD